MNNYKYALGRRKTSTATVRLFDQAGVSTVNEKPIDQAFASQADQVKLMQPFRVVELQPNQYSFSAKVRGGGVQSQLEAVRHAISRCLSQESEEFHKALKQAGLLTRDPRMVERKKTGRRKARKSEQYSKR